MALFRRRVGRLATLLGLGAAGVLVALAWAVFGTARPAEVLASGQVGGPRGAEARPASITYREPSAAGLVPYSVALQSARLFSGRQDLLLDGGLERGGDGPASFAVYYLETPDGHESFRIEARTAEVLEMTRLGELPVSGGSDSLDSIRAELAAERFAADHFLGFEALSLVERNATPAAGGGQLYSFKWTMVASESGAELPTSVSVSLAATSGEVVWYLAQRESTTLDVRPRVGRDEAVMTAALLADRTERWDARTPTSVRLQVIFDHDNQQRLVWAVTFPGRPGLAPEARPSLRILVDAHTGEPVSSPS